MLFVYLILFSLRVEQTHGLSIFSLYRSYLFSSSLVSFEPMGNKLKSVVVTLATDYRYTSVSRYTSRRNKFHCSYTNQRNRFQCSYTNQRNIFQCSYTNCCSKLQFNKYMFTKKNMQRQKIG